MGEGRRRETRGEGGGGGNKSPLHDNSISTHVLLAVTASDIIGSDPKRKLTGQPPDSALMCVSLGVSWEKIRGRGEVRSWGVVKSFGCGSKAAGPIV